MALRITGKLPSGQHKEQLQQSPNYKNGSFQNLSDTPMKPEGISYWKIMREFFGTHPETEPARALPSVITDLDKLQGSLPIVVWFGHSSYFLRIEGKNFLIDPVFSGNASPVSFMVKAFPGSNIYKAENMPLIDYLILTHDHYDHLDHRTLLQLKNKTSQIICSLGLASHLLYWGFDKEKITELDWWQEIEISNGMKLTAAPARHFSGRGIKRGQTFWSSFILNATDHNFYLGGDSGYDDHFRIIGEKFGPFDLAILESGQYNKMWPLIHMMPEEMVQAAIDLNARTILPVHWGKFKLSMHPWNEPVKRVVAKAKESGISVATPMIGEPLIINGDYLGTNWWEF